MNKRSGESRAQALRGGLQHQSGVPRGTAVGATRDSYPHTDIIYQMFASYASDCMLWVSDILPEKNLWEAIQLPDKGDEISTDIMSVA